MHRWRMLLTVLGAMAVGHPAISAQEPPDPLGGASRPRVVPDRPAPADGQYKRIGQWAVTLILEGRPDDAVRYVNDIIGKRGEDAELHFLLALAHAGRGDLSAAEAAMNRAIELDLPPQRFLAGPRELLEPLRASEKWMALRQRFADATLHGPMLGDLTDRGVRVWVRTAAAADVQVSVGASPDSLRPSGDPVSSSEATDFTAVVRVDGLRPQTEYHYRLTINGREQPESYVFRTLPTAGEPCRFDIAFGGGAGFVPENERMWDTIGGVRPDALLLLGDNIYSDDPETPAMQRYCYYRRQSQPEFRELVSRTPVFAIWDDHDFSTDDSWGGPLVDVPAWKRPVWNIFRQNWVNPGYGGGEAKPGVWFDFVIGDVHFVMLDGRYYRTDAGRHGGEGVERPSMLGPEQLAWLKQTLAGSTGTFKVLVSPVPWDFRAKSGRAGRDTWRGYAGEREAIFSFIEQRRIEGVVLLSADRHRSDAWLIERPGGYDLYEFNSSRLTNEHVHPEMDEALFSYNKKQSFGRVAFDTTAETPTVTYDVITIDGDIVHSLTVPRPRLSFP